MSILMNVFDNILTRRGKNRIDLEEKRIKWQIFTNHNVGDFIHQLAKNYFLKLKV
jgi:hypothetical protein